jgi:hypothetical protein
LNATFFVWFEIVELHDLFDSDEIVLLDESVHLILSRVFLGVETELWFEKFTKHEVKFLKVIAESL